MDFRRGGKYRKENGVEKWVFLCLAMGELEIYILDILAQCNKPKLNPACISSLGFSHLYILMLWLIVTQVIVLHSYT